MSKSMVVAGAAAMKPGRANALGGYYCASGARARARRKARGRQRQGALIKRLRFSAGSPILTPSAAPSPARAVGANAPWDGGDHEGEGAGGAGHVGVAGDRAQDRDR